MDSSNSHAHAEAVRFQAELIEQAKREHQQQLRRQRQNQQQQQDSENEDLKPSDSFSNTVSTAVDDDWTLSDADAGSLRSRRSLREQQLREQQQQQQLHQQQAYSRSKSASSVSSSTPSRDTDARLEEPPTTTRSAPQRQRNDRIRPRQNSISETRSEYRQEDEVEMGILRHCLSADAATFNNIAPATSSSNTNNNLQDGLHPCHSADDLNTTIQEQDRHNQSMSSLPLSGASTSSTGRTAQANTNHNHSSNNRRLPRRVVSASETSSSSQSRTPLLPNSPPQTPVAAYLHTCTTELDQPAARAVARISSPSLDQAQEPARPQTIDQDIFPLWGILTPEERAEIAQQYGYSSIEDFERCMSNSQQPGNLHAAAPRSPTAATPAVTRSGGIGGDDNSAPEAPFIIEPRIPYRRKTSPNSEHNFSDSNTDGPNDTGGGAVDYIPEEHSWVGAFSVRNVDALGNSLVPEAPTSPGRPTSIRRAASIAASESTITQSIYTRQSVFSDEQTSQYNPDNNNNQYSHNYAAGDEDGDGAGNNDDTCITEPDPLPYLPVARIVLPADEQNRRDQENEKNHEYKRKQLLYSFMAGVCCMLILGAAIITAMIFTMDIFGMGDPGNDGVVEEQPNITVTSPTASPTMPPTMAPTSIVLPLPNVTLRAMEQSRRSPQGLAYQWFLDDLELPQNTELPLQRQMQRYALATLYYSTGGYTSWERSDGWLDHSLPECEWETVLDRGMFAPYRLCDPDTGEYESLVLSSNGLKGSIPPEISFLTTLKYLDMEKNDELGVEPGLPTQIGDLTGLEELHFLYSYIPGRIPSELGRLTKLKVLDLEANKFGNTIPSELGQLSDLVDLKLQYNKLEGELPADLSSMLSRQLMLFNVENNILTGTIPLEYNTALASRKNAYGQISGEQGTVVFQARFANNDLTGTVPSEFCSLQQRLRFDCDPDLLCGCDCACSAT